MPTRGLANSSNPSAMNILSSHLNSEVGENVLTVSNVSGEESGSNQVTRRARPRRRGVLQTGAVIALVFAFVFLTAVITCFHLASQKVRKHEGIGRRLASGEDEDGERLISHILDECLDMEQEMNAISTQAEEYGEEDKSLSGVISDCLDMQEESGQLVSEGHLPEKSEAVSSILWSIHQIQKNLEGDQSKDMFPVSALSPGEASAVPLDLRQASLSTPSSLEPLHSTLSGMSPALTTGGASLPAGQDLEPLPHVSTTEHLKQPFPPATKKQTKRSSSPPALGGPAENKRRRETAKRSRDVLSSVTHQGAERAIVGSPLAPTRSDQSLASSHPDGSLVPLTPTSLPEIPPSADSASTSQAAPFFALPGPAPPMPLDTHLYFRLPVLEPGVITEEFNRRRAFSPGRIRHPHAHLLKIHRLLAQPSITAGEAGQIILACEEVVNDLILRQRTPLVGQKPNIAASRLAKRYLCLEALFCAIQVIGSQMRAESWWQDLLELVPTDYHYLGGLRAEKPAGARLALLLSAAIKSLKRGIRPAEQITVQLKRDIFRCKNYEFGLREGKWDPWREDDDGTASDSSPRS